MFENKTMLNVNVYIELMNKYMCSTEVYILVSLLYKNKIRKTYHSHLLEVQQLFLQKQIPTINTNINIMTIKT